MKPCPFCGADFKDSGGFSRRTAEDAPEHAYSRIECWRCGCEGPEAKHMSYDNHATASRAAVEAWNMRGESMPEPGAERDAAFVAGLENAAEIAELARDPSSVPRILREKAAHLRAMASKGN